MKKLTLLSFILIFNLGFSQTEKLTNNSLNLISIIEERNTSLNSQIIINDFEEIVKVDFSLPSNNSEGKFIVYDTSNNKTLNSIDNRSSKSVFNIPVKENVNTKRQSFVAENYQDFINSIVIKMKLEDTTRFKNSFQNQTEKNITFLENKTLYAVAKLSNDKVDVIIGGLNLDKNKFYTSELQHSIRHSLNLLVVNF